MTPELEAFDNAAREAFPEEFASGDIFNLGVFNCRRKNNTANGPWSEHSWANAKDYGIKNWDTAAGNRLGDRFASWAKSSGLASEVFWEVPQHFNHVHVTANPRKNYDNEQIPPCAGGSDDDMTPEQEAFLNALMEKEAKTGTFSKDIITRDELVKALEAQPVPENVVRRGQRVDIVKGVIR